MGVSEEGADGQRRPLRCHHIGEGSGIQFMAALEEVLPPLLTSVLALMKQQARQRGRVVLGAVVTRVAAAQAAVLRRRHVLPTGSCRAPCSGRGPAISRA